MHLNKYLGPWRLYNRASLLFEIDYVVTKAKTEGKTFEVLDQISWVY